MVGRLDMSETGVPGTSLEEGPFAWIKDSTCSVQDTIRQRCFQLALEEPCLQRVALAFRAEWYRYYVARGAFYCPSRELQERSSTKHEADGSSRRDTLPCTATFQLERETPGRAQQRCTQAFNRCVRG